VAGGDAAPPLEAVDAPPAVLRCLYVSRSTVAARSELAVPTGTGCRSRPVRSRWSTGSVYAQVKVLWSGSGDPVLETCVRAPVIRRSPAGNHLDGDGAAGHLACRNRCSRRSRERYGSVCGSGRPAARRCSPVPNTLPMSSGASPISRPITIRRAVARDAKRLTRLVRGSGAYDL
jgi:hypothetical protein